MFVSGSVTLNDVMTAPSVASLLIWPVYDDLSNEGARLRTTLMVTVPVFEEFLAGDPRSVAIILHCKRIFPSMKKNNKAFCYIGLWCY